MLNSVCKLILAIVVLTGISLEVSAQKNTGNSPLPRHREGGTPYNPNQSLRPYALDFSAFGRSDTNVDSPPEYAPVKGVLYRYSSGSWPGVVTDLVAALTSDPAHDEIAYVVVSSASQQNSATNAFAAAGADLSKVEFLIQPSDSIWMRDYGPHFVWLNDTLTIADSHYYPGRPNDNFVPTEVGDDNFGFLTKHMGLYYSGGNFQPGPNRSGFVTSLVNLDNPGSEGFDENLIRELYQTKQGIDTLHILPQLPFSVDGTGHIDMWLYLIDEDTVVISEFKPGSNSTAIEITNNAVDYMESLGFEVFRPQAWNSGGTHYTYANAFRVNNRIFIPAYGTALVPGGFSSYNDEDADALATWQAAAGPGVEIVPIQCRDIIPASGAIHCIVKQVPRYVGSAPSVSVISPSGGDVMIAGNVETIRWSATDTDNTEISSVELSYSTDSGASWQSIATVSNSLEYSWTVPDEFSAASLIRVVATSSDLDLGTGTSNPFLITPGVQNRYEFDVNAGIDRKIFGSSTSSWNAVNGNPSPVSGQISASNYARLATSNATGGDNDSDRYIAPYPGSTRETTHVFEFEISEDADSIDEMVFHWEGYADWCSQCELYVWDVAQQQWGDGTSFQLAQNRFLDSFAGNRDGELTGVIRSDLSNYVDAENKVRFLIYGERDGNETFHDYAALTVKQSTAAIVVPDSFEVSRGVLESGGLSDLELSDDLDIRIRTAALDSETRTEFQVKGTSPLANPTSFQVTLEGSVDTGRDTLSPASTFGQVIELYNYDDDVWEVIDSRSPSLRRDGSPTVVQPAGDLSRFVDDKTLCVEGRIRYTSTARRALASETDQFSWSIF